MKKTIRTTSVLLLAALLSLAAGCSGGGGEVAPQTSAPAAGSEAVSSETVTTELREEVPEKKFNGYEFKITTDIKTWGIYNNEHLVVESENGEVLNDAILRRNKNVEERFDITLKESVNATSALVSQNVMAGDDPYDCYIICYGVSLGQDSLLDFNKLPYVDLSKPWWDQKSQEWNSLGGVVNQMLCNIMITHYDSTVAMLYNQKLAKDFDCPDFYAAVRDGKWTQELMFANAAKAERDLDGNGKRDETDQFGYTALSGRYTELLLASDLNWTELDASGMPKLAVNNERFITRATKVGKALAAATWLYDPRTQFGKDAGVFPAFLESRTLFYAHGIGSVQQFRDMENDFGALPMPKYDEAQESYFNNVDAAKYLMVPLTAKDQERTGILLEAMAAESFRTLKPQYYETMLKNKYLRDEASVEMLDEYVFTNLMRGNARGATFGFNYTSVDSLASTIESNINTWNAAIQKYVEMMLGK